MNNLRDWLRRNWQIPLNWFLFLVLGYGACWRAWQAWTAEQLDFVEISFFTHNLVLILIIVLRERHRAINGSLFQQAVALVAFFSGIAFDEHRTASPALVSLACGVTVAVMALGTVCLFNLGRSFGILIAARTIKTRGLYAIIRHPMYATDISWRAAFILQNPGAYNISLAVVSTAAYVYRAMLEERFLSQFPEYREYMERVRYRFIPGIF